jgi:hypothetical protein
MSSLAEAAAAAGPLAASLAAGVDTISEGQTVTFTKYVRVVLPLDGFLFWVRADILAPSAILNTGPLNQSPINQPPGIMTPAATLTIAGSMHYTTVMSQGESTDRAIHRMVFTAESPVLEFASLGPNEMYLGEFEGIQFSFSQRGMYYQQAGLHHYSGDAIYSNMQSQIIDDPNQFDASSVVVSNSLPFWLTQNSICPVYPSFLVPDNLPPPYITAHIEPSGTRALQTTAYIDQTGTSWALAADRVRLTLYGLRNNDALDFLLLVIGSIGYDGDTVGLMNNPAVRDEKATQVELGILAMKKTIEFEVSYYQQRVRDVAIQYILSCIPQFIIA